MNSSSTTSRRNFLGNTIKLGAAASLLAYSPGSLSAFAQKPRKELSILVLGGTSFLGPHQIAYAMDRGHSITTFTRGKTQPTIYQEYFKDVESLVGDRENNLEALKGKKWDAVIDNSGRRAKWTKDTAELLKDNVGLYLYTSSTGVYYPYLGDGIKEDTKLVSEMPEGLGDYEKMEYGYGVMKTNSEAEAMKAFGKDRTILVRPTYMMGPADRTDRFTYWPARLAKGGSVVVPGKQDDPVQYIDVRDVAEWMIRLIEMGSAGTYNAVGPSSKQGMHAFVYGAHAAFSSPVEFTHIDDHKFLLDNKVRYAIPWIMPIEGDYGTARIDNSHSIRNGLTFRPLSNSVQDIHEWWYSDAVEKERREKLMNGPRSLHQKEADLIEKWSNLMK